MSSFQKWSGSAIVLVAIAAIALFLSIVTIEPGEVGVRFDPLGGGIQESQLGEGFHIKPPWVQIYRYNTKTQVFTMSGAEEGASQGGTVRTVTNEGLYVDLDISIQYKIDSTNAWQIRQLFGMDGGYQDIIVLPQIRSTLRDVVSQFTAAQVYGEGKSVVELAIFEDLVENLEPKHVFVEQVLLRSVTLPDQLVQSIEAKKSAEQDAQAMEYILLKAEQEAQQLRIEAQGIADANEIIADSLSTEYIMWYWVDNLDQHDSVIYVPIGDDGLPLFKNIDE